MSNNSLLPTPTPTDVDNDPNTPAWFQNAKAREAIDTNIQNKHAKRSKVRNPCIAIIIILLIGVGVYYGVINTL